MAYSFFSGRFLAGADVGGIDLHGDVFGLLLLHTGLLLVGEGLQRKEKEGEINNMQMSN